MAERKKSYEDAFNKKRCREFLFSLFADKHLDGLIGLAGPDINQYISWCKQKGYNDLELWENTPDVLFNQMKDINSSVVLKYGDILNTNIKPNVLYDLDYCVTIKYMSKHLKRFKDNFIMTFSLRFGENETINTFFKDRREKIMSVTHKYAPYVPVEHTVYTTTSGDYIYLKYFDTSTMCCFAKIN
jgi:hypothetical protein